MFSLAALRRIKEEGVAFQSHIDGSPRFLSPETSIEVQTALGSDIMMAFDVCSPYPCDYNSTAASMERRFAGWRDVKRPGQGRIRRFLGLCRAGCIRICALKSAKATAAMDLPGIAVGGLSVGEPKEVMYEMLEAIRPYLPEDKPRYLMGVGSPDCLVEGFMRGIDMMDCVLPTRIARNGTFMTSRGRMVIMEC